MQLRDLPFLLILPAAGVLIWTQNLYAVSSLDDTLPILLSLPLFVFMASPWKFRDTPPALSYSTLITATACYLIGFVADMVWLLALSWTLALWTWVSSRVDEARLPHMKKLMILPFLAFPWLTIECTAIGWYFRLSGAWATAKGFSALGFNVVHEGTRIIVMGLPVGIGEACSGINVLQSMLIAGSALTFLYLGRTKAYWPNIILLFALSWLANTMRIFILCLVALTMGREFALGIFHTFGGWLVLFLMMFLCLGVLSLQRSYLKKRAFSGEPA